MKVATMIDLLKTFNDDAEILIELLDGDTSVAPSGVVKYDSYDKLLTDCVYITVAIKDENGNVI